MWTYLRKKHNLQVLEIPERMYWNDCSASVVFISIGGKTKRETSKMFIFIEKIFRGHISPHEANYVEMGKGVKYIQLIDNAIALSIALVYV